MGQQEQFGVLGLGVMGRSLALNLVDHGIDTWVWNLEPQVIPELLAAHPAPNLNGTADLEAFVKRLNTPRRILMMITAGDPVDAMLKRLLPLLEPGDVVVDGGNSWYADTLRRQKDCDAAGIRFVGMGISGGEEGARHGPSMMPGGDAEAVRALMPVLERIAAQTDTGPCVTHVGKGGAGHFVKMVHNGIEYADMQFLAEAYDLLRRGEGADADTIADLFADWNEGPLEAFLLELSAGVLRRKDERTGKPLVELVLDAAGQKGTGRWTAGEALSLGVAAPSITAAVDARVLSSMKAARVEASTLLDGPSPGAGAGMGGDASKTKREREVHDALYAARIVTWAQGLDLMRTASRTHAWDIDLAEVLRVWRGGCIIRSRLLDPLRAALQEAPERAVLIAPALREALRAHADGLREVVARGARLGIPTPVFAASLAYLDAYRTASLPQNLTQAQRDAFGAHTYRRVDAPDEGPIHTDWQVPLRG